MAGGKGNGGTMSLAWSGDFRQSREDELERAMEREDRRAMIDPVWAPAPDEDPVETPAERNFANWNADLADHVQAPDPPETPAQREYRVWNEYLDDYDFTWEELHQ
jgi:hypothetical protein